MAKVICEIPRCAWCACMYRGRCHRLGVDMDPRETACDWAQEPWKGFYTEKQWAKVVWRELEDVTVDEDGNIDVPFDDPYLGHFTIGTSKEDIWRMLEETFEGVRVYDLMYPGEE